MDVHGDPRFVFSCLWHMDMSSFLRPQTVNHPPNCYVIPTILESLDFESTPQRPGDTRFQGEAALYLVCLVPFPYLQLEYHGA